jgi:hypothetical protein
LRANGSAQGAADQRSNPEGERLDCFVARAPRNDDGNVALARRHPYKNKNTWEAELRAIVVLGITLLAATPAAAQKSGGILRLYHNDNPPSASLLEESTIASVTPFAAVFNNLVVFDPAKIHESIETVIQTWLKAGPGTPQTQN